MVVEEPKLSVEAKMEHYEIRKYEPTLLAETVIKMNSTKPAIKPFR